MKVHPLDPTRKCGRCGQPTPAWVDLTPDVSGIDEAYNLPCGHSVLRTRMLPNAELALAILMVDL